MLFLHSTKNPPDPKHHFWRLAIPTYRVKNYAVLAIQLFCGLIATLDIVAHLMGFI